MARCSACGGLAYELGDHAQGEVERFNGPEWDRVRGPRITAAEVTVCPPCYRARRRVMGEHAAHEHQREMAEQAATAKANAPTRGLRGFMGDDE